MATLYLTEQGSILRKSSNHFIVKKYKETLLEIPCADVDHIMIYGNIQVTTPALWELAQHNIEIAYFTKSGKLLLQLTPNAPKNVPLRLAQYQKQLDPQFCLRMSKTIVQAKLSNAIAIVQTYHMNHPELNCKSDLAIIETMQTNAVSCKEMNQLRGFEGAATAAYFKILGRMLQPPWQFLGRMRRPPKDPVNAVLSFGYVIVGNEIRSLLDGIGFDPFIGYYHKIDYGRPSLALDLLEEFRHSLVDRLMLQLFNQKVFTEDDFTATSRDGVYLDREGKKKFFLAYERYLGDYGDDENRSKSVGSFRKIFKLQAHQLAKAIQEDAAYEPFQIRSKKKNKI